MQPLEWVDWFNNRRLLKPISSRGIHIMTSPMSVGQAMMSRSGSTVATAPISFGAPGDTWMPCRADRNK